MKASFLMEPKKPKPDTADLSENRIVVSKNITICTSFFREKCTLCYRCEVESN